MRCHYEHIEGVGKVLIPGCAAVAWTGDIEMCTCSPTTYRQFETQSYREEVKRLKSIIQKLEKENEYYAQLLEKDTTIIDYKK